MALETICFRGLLANVDASVLKVQLDHGFEIVSNPLNESIEFVAQQERKTIFDAGYKIASLPNDEHCYFIVKDFQANIEANPDGSLDPCPSELMQFEAQLNEGYLQRALRLMRLYTEGNICMPVEYLYAQNPEAPCVRRQSDKPPSRRDAYTLEDSEILGLQQFIKIELPFSDRHLELALENFELSYSILNAPLSFLSLMIAMEVLFADGGGLSHSVSRNAAVLLGRDRNDAERIFVAIKALYGKRSAIVHHGIKANKINRDDLLNLRLYVRESIKKAHKIGRSKKDLFEPP